MTTKNSDDITAFLRPSVKYPPIAANSSSKSAIYVPTAPPVATFKERILRNYSRFYACQRWGGYSARFALKGFSPAHPLYVKRAEEGAVGLACFIVRLVAVNAPISAETQDKVAQLFLSLVPPSSGTIVADPLAFARRFSNDSSTNEKTKVLLECIIKVLNSSNYARPQQAINGALCTKLHDAIIRQKCHSANNYGISKKAYLL
ncbi:hypothetical protein BCV72DRAFT_242162 [Rhizopus microsporus var. microsporus]|uniref:Uncharacterized protein n=2 Tax=Rhizopus microsporus TaxID=58291 RepID=A0A2G4SKK9_RHIZD|nr:uncharacterized protein RHIMIDRAFT_315548 [Rhizopus microsporus ATCC 52813]ORE06311.1 hypothetical protein BCV72DRAFT_242162 [Rhizopus microsporus var. microsporus]PHZ09299.1 hypothetical protein RHIMIDRAFT_315548 [Rhizopus microsporus ATCC 52813]